MRGLLAWCWILAMAVRAHADANPPDGARLHYERGRVYYNLGEFDAAIVQFKAAYQQSPAPGLLFNIAQAYRAKKDYERAEYFYTTFLREDPDASERDYVEARLDELRAAPRPPPLIPAMAPVKEPPRTLELVGIGVAAGGTALLATGVYFGMRASDESDELSALYASGGTYSPHYRQLYDDGRRDSTVSLVLVGVGGAALVAGGVMTYLGWRAGRAPRVTVAPTLIPRGGGVGLSCVF